MLLFPGTGSSKKLHAFSVSSTSCNRERSYAFIIAFINVNPRRGEQETHAFSVTFLSCHVEGSFEFIGIFINVNPRRGEQEFHTLGMASVSSCMEGCPVVTSTGTIDVNSRSSEQ